MSGKRVVTVVAVLTLALAACATEPTSDTAALDDNVDVIADPTAPASDQDVSSGFVVNGGISVAEALAYQGDQPVAVQGFLVLSGESAMLCSALAESFPPQCGGDRLVVTNPDAASGTALVEEGDVQWSEETVTVIGRVSEGELTIDSTTKG